MDTRRAISDELHRPARRRFPRRRVTVKSVNDLYQGDLVEMLPYANVNKGMRYILTIINCFTKVAIALPLKNKTAIEVAKVLEPILQKHKMKHFQTDQGKEWFNLHVQKLMTKYNINHYATFSELKASVVERLNRTLKEKMWKEFTARGTYEWLSILPRIVQKYNSTVHRTIGMKPKDVRSTHVKNILCRINATSKESIVREKVKQKFNVDDHVRISKYKQVFKKGYLPNWTNEIFTIFAIRPTKPVTYTLQDSKGEILKGSFYNHELIKSKTGNVYLIEKILKRKGNKVLVRWAGFDGESDSWIDKGEIL